MCLPNFCTHYSFCLKSGMQYICIFCTVFCTLLKPQIMLLYCILRKTMHNERNPVYLYMRYLLVISLEATTKFNIFTSVYKNKDNVLQNPERIAKSSLFYNFFRHITIKENSIHYIKKILLMQQLC